MRTQLRTFPSTDREFAAFAREAFAATPGDDIAALQAALRERYPAAVVRAQSELARTESGVAVWYAFRFGSIRMIDERWDAPGVATAVLDDERRFVEVSEPLASIVELPVGAILGQPIEAFANPSDPTIVDDLLALWDEFVKMGRLEGSIRFNRRDGRPRELAYRLTANAAGPGRHRLTVRELGSAG